MLNLKDQKYGLLMGVKFLYNDPKRGPIWEFRCDCGNITHKSAYLVKNKGTKSCGCLQIKRFNLKNQKFGRLTVLDHDHHRKSCHYWKCLCDCGKICIINGKCLKNKKTKSCGCLKKESISNRQKKNLLNKIFGELTVIKFSHIDPISKRYFWICECKCGNIVCKNSKYLLSQDTNSCGCLRHKGTKDVPQRLFNRIKHGAKIRNLVFTITINDIQNLLEKQNYRCALSNIPIKCGWYVNKKNINFIPTTASLDRIDSKQGYTMDNIQWIHKDINKMKTNLDQKYFITLCSAISKHLNI